MLAADSPIVGVVLGGCFIGMALWNLLAPSAWLSLDGRGPIVTMKMAGLAAFFGVCGASLIWSVYLLLRYAFAFAKTRRQALQLFADGDLAA